jgi:hypothetical protein
MSNWETDFAQNPDWCQNRISDRNAQRLMMAVAYVCVVAVMTVAVVGWWMGL